MFAKQKAVLYPVCRFWVKLVFTKNIYLYDEIGYLHNMMDNKIKKDKFSTHVVNFSQKSRFVNIYLYLF